MIDTFTPYFKARVAARQEFQDQLADSAIATPNQIAEAVYKAIAPFIWEQAYAQGAEDQRTAIAFDVPEYPNAARVNPYE